MSRCTYCDFHSSACDAASLLAFAPRWLAAVERHLAELAQRFGRDTFSTVYIGGGTPSFLPPAILERTLSVIAACRLDDTEWSIEANPEDLHPELLDLLRRGGINRLSLGIQSLEDAARRTVGRRGSADATRRVLDTVASRWDGRLSVDMMYGLPNQSARGLADDVRAIVERGIGHVSLYELTLEEGTPLELGARSGAIRLPDDDERADQYDAARDVLRAAGFEHYEVSNWALPGQRCAHNMHYWSMDDWLAVGPSGVGNIGRDDGGFSRLENAADDEQYYADPSGSTRIVTVARPDAMFESLMMALRTSAGLALADFERRFGTDPLEVFGPLPGLFPESIVIDSGSWRPTERGMDTLNRVLVRALSNLEEFNRRAEAEAEETLL